MMSWIFFVGATHQKEDGDLVLLTMQMKEAALKVLMMNLWIFEIKGSRI